MKFAEYHRRQFLFNSPCEITIMTLPGVGIFESLIVVCIGLMMFAVIPICCWRIVEKTGYPAWWSLACLLPGVNIALLIVLAFSDWPALQGQHSGESFS